MAWLLFPNKKDEYLELFASHGYDSIVSFDSITNSGDLDKIGIKKDYHQKTILENLHKLIINDYLSKESLDELKNDEKIIYEELMKLFKYEKKIKVKLLYIHFNFFNFFNFFN